MNDFDEKLDRLAEISISIGVNLQAGQELIVNAPVEAVALVRAITKYGYRAGASDVLVNFSDAMLARIHFDEGNEPSFDHAPAWRYESIARALEEGAALLNVRGTDPNLLAGVDPARQARSQKANGLASQKLAAMIGGFKANWSIIPFAHPAWATAMFPDLTETDAVARLWNAIFMATRVDGAGAVANWSAHSGRLQDRAAFLNEKRFESLHFMGPGTDLRVGLIEGHVWVGGAANTITGITCLPNIPTEEVFTMPHNERVEGIVRATKPLSYGGTLIEGIEVRFEGGRIVESRARIGAETFARLLQTDEGAARLGEVALVPDASPISQSGLLFLNTLFDENAASHIAIGRALAVNAPGGNAADLAGANQSLIHVDWMIGSAEIDVDGILPGGVTVPVMRQGAFAG
jgi:aminopeptidase